MKHCFIHMSTVDKCRGIYKGGDVSRKAKLNQSIIRMRNFIFDLC